MSYFKAKMHQIRCWLGSDTDSAGEAYSAFPNLLASKGRWRRTGGKGKGGEKGGAGTYF